MLICMRWVYEVLPSSLATVIVLNFVTRDEDVIENAGFVEVCINRSAITEEDFLVEVFTSTGSADSKSHADIYWLCTM